MAPQISYRVNSQRGGWKPAALFWLLPLVSVGCENRRSPQAENPSPERATATRSDTHAEDSNPFEIYSTLSGKMARMEELLNGIDRFIETPGLEERVIQDTQEFNQLLEECRGLYPTSLPIEDRTGFDRAIGQTLTLSNRLRDAIHANDMKDARKVITLIIQQRERAHTRFSLPP